MQLVSPQNGKFDTDTATGVRPEGEMEAGVGCHVNKPKTTRSRGDAKPQGKPILQSWICGHRTLRWQMCILTAPSVELTAAPRYLGRRCNGRTAPGVSRADHRTRPGTLLLSGGGGIENSCPGKQ